MPDIFVARSKKTAAKTSSQPEKTLLEGKETSAQPYSKGKPFIKIAAKKPTYLFSSFRKYPKGIRFQNLEAKEFTILLLRKDFIVNLPWILIGVCLIIAPFLFGPLALLSGINPSFLQIKHFIFFGIFYYLLIAIYIYVNFVTWYFNFYLVTNIRVVEVKFISLIYKNVSATKISLVQDVSASQVGISRSLFNYGDVLVQTAAYIENFTFDSVPQPEKVVDIIEDLIGKEKHV